MKNPYTNHANWLVQNDRHGKTSVESFIKAFNIPTNKQDLFKKRLEFLCYIVYEEGLDAGEIKTANYLRELLKMDEIPEYNQEPKIDFHEII